MANLRTHPTRQDTWMLTVHLEGNSLGIWDKKTGGAKDSDESKYYPGGMKPSISLGGRVTTENLVLTREYDWIDDHEKIQDIYDAVGHGTIVVSQRPMDINGNAHGNAVTWHGVLKRCSVPDVDSEGTGPATYEIEVSVTGYPTSV